MVEWVITEEVVTGRTGRQFVDRIRRPVSPLPEIPIPDGHVRVHCACGAVHIVPEAEWHQWNDTPLEDRARIKQGGCDCKHFKKLSA